MLPTLLALFLAPLAPSSPLPQALAEEEAAFRVDGELVPVGAFGEWLLRTAGSKRARDFALDWIVEREARRRGVTVSDEEVAAAIDRDVAIRIENAFRGEREAWLAELERTGRDERDYRFARASELHPWLLAGKLAAEGRVVPERKIRREWELAFGKNGRRYDLRLIYFKVVQDMEGPPPGTEEFTRRREERREEVRERALEVRRELASGADFGALAARWSDDPATRAGAGVPAEPFRHFGWPHAFNDALEALEPGDVSEPLWGRGGWWLVEVREVELTPLEDVRDEIEALLVQRGPESDEIGAVQERLMEKVEMRLLPALFERPAGGEWPAAREPVLTVDGEPVTRAEYALYLLRSEGSTWQNRFLEDHLLEKRAAELGLLPSEAEVEARAREQLEFRMAEAHQGSRESFETYLAASGMGPELYLASLRWRARSDVLAERLILRGREVGEEELRLRWRDLYGEEGRGLEVRSLAVGYEAPPLPPDLSQAELQEVMEQAALLARLRAADLVERLRDGEDFATLAKREGARSKPGAVQAAATRFRPDLWPEDIAGAVRALEPGEISEPLRFGLFWLVFEIVRRTDVPFESVREELRAEALARRPYGIELATFRNQILKEAEIEVLPGARR